MTEPEWLSKDLMMAVHDEQLAEHGGGEGVRDAGALDSAMMRPRNLALYGAPNIVALAAAYGFGIARNHPFVDGNKRTAFVAAEVFLELNGMTVTASDEACVLTMVRLAAGEMEETVYAHWLRENAVWQD